uniref:Putative secreted protein n=1 Tax=Ixodes ricinus TaxID=34613 RepID=A0A147BMZ5_IXORI
MLRVSFLWKMSISLGGLVLCLRRGMSSKEWALSRLQERRKSGCDAVRLPLVFPLGRCSGMLLTEFLDFWMGVPRHTSHRNH